MLVLETSWEVCNKMGGIYTVLSSRASAMMSAHDENVVFIGPYINKTKPKDFIDSCPKLLKGMKDKLKCLGLDFVIGKWDVPSQPAVVLVDYTPLFEKKGDFYFEMWKNFSVESDKGYGDYDDSCIFSIAASMVMKILSDNIKNSEQTFAIFNEWQTAMGLLHTKLHNTSVKTMFITHATTVGRSICGNNKELYKYLHGYNGDQMAEELNVFAKHKIEKLAAHQADVFATVSELTAIESKQLLEKEPVVLPNGFESDFVPKSAKYTKAKKDARKKLSDIVNYLTGCDVDDNDLFVITSGRYEYRNKGIDLFVESMNEIRKNKGLKNKIYAFVTVPAWVAEARSDLQLLIEKNEKRDTPLQHSTLTHWLMNMQEDKLMQHLRFLNMDNNTDENVKIFFVPCYLNGSDGIFNMKYYELLPGFDISLFPSYYEPWGYTPLESIAFGVPTITTTLAGFGLWAKSEMKKDKLSPVFVIDRDDDSFIANATEIAKIITEYSEKDNSEKTLYQKEAKALAKKAEWSKFYKYYIEAMNISKH